MENWSTILKRSVEYKPQIELLNVKINLNNYPKKDCYGEYADVEEHPISQKRKPTTVKDCHYWFENKGPQKFVENWSTILKRSVEYKPQILLLNLKINLNNYPKKDYYGEYADVEEHPISQKRKPTILKRTVTTDLRIKGQKNLWKIDQLS